MNKCFILFFDVILEDFLTFKGFFILTAPLLISHFTHHVYFPSEIDAVDTGLHSI